MKFDDNILTEEVEKEISKLLIVGNKDFDIIENIYSALYKENSSLKDKITLYNLENYILKHYNDDVLAIDEMMCINKITEYIFNSLSDNYSIKFLDYGLLNSLLLKDCNRQIFFSDEENKLIDDHIEIMNRKVGKKYNYWNSGRNLKDLDQKALVDFLIYCANNNFNYDAQRNYVSYLIENYNKDKSCGELEFLANFIVKELQMICLEMGLENKTFNNIMVSKIEEDYYLDKSDQLIIFNSELSLEKFIFIVVFKFREIFKGVVEVKSNSLLEEIDKLFTEKINNKFLGSSFFELINVYYQTVNFIHIYCYQDSLRELACDKLFSWFKDMLMDWFDFEYLRYDDYFITSKFLIDNLEHTIKGLDSVESELINKLYKDGKFISLFEILNTQDIFNVEDLFINKVIDNELMLIKLDNYTNDIAFNILFKVINYYLEIVKYIKENEEYLDYNGENEDKYSCVRERYILRLKHMNILYKVKTYYLIVDRINCFIYNNTIKINKMMISNYSSINTILDSYKLNKLKNKDII